MRATISTVAFCTLLLASLLAVGCRSLSAPPPVRAETSTRSAARSVHTNTPPASRVFGTATKLNPLWGFGNADEPVAPEWFRVDRSCPDFQWHLRNFGHNFTFYVIGIADRPFTRVGRVPEAVFCPDGGWNWAVCRYGWLRLPFISYRHGGFRFYCGWRERGAFGFKLACFGEIEPPGASPPAPDAPAPRAPPPTSLSPTR